MAKAIPVGTRGEAEETVEFKHTLTAHHPELPAVYSTPDMIRLMETAAFLALHPCCEGDEITVGTSINIEHRAASGIGARTRLRQCWSHSMAGFMWCGWQRGMTFRRLGAAPWEGLL